MDFKRIFGLKKNKNEVATFEDTEISYVNKNSEDIVKQNFSRSNASETDFHQDETLNSIENVGILSITEKLKVGSKNPFLSLKNKFKDDKVVIEEKKPTFKLKEKNGLFSKEDLEELNNIAYEEIKPHKEITDVELSSQDDFNKASVPNEYNSLFASDSFSNLDLKSYTKPSDSFDDSLIEVYQKKLPLIGSLSLSKQYKVVTSFAVVCFVGIVVGGLLYGNARSKENAAINFVSEMSSDLISINDLFSDIKSGEGSAYEKLMSTSSKLKDNFALTKDTNIFTSKSAELTVIKNKMNDNLNRVYTNLGGLKSKSKLLMDRNESVENFSNNINKLNTKIDTFVNLYEQKSLTKQEMHNLFTLKTETETINSDLVTILLSDKVNQDIVMDLNQTRQNFKNNLSELQANIGDATSQKELNEAYQDIVKDWVKVSVGVDEVINKSINLTQIRDLYSKNEIIVGTLINDIKQIIKIYKENDLTGEKLAIVIMLLSIILFGLSMLATFYIYSFEKDNKSLFDKAENNRNQSSILKLLNELMPLQDGDLTRKTTVTEEITGAIADSINATIDSLSSLVRKIKNTSIIMSEKTNNVKSISLEMLQTTEVQTKSLNETGISVIEIANAISEISNKTDQGAEEARKSVLVSEEGEKQVQDAVRAMHEININMNETVHLVQKVGGSSKQISEIVDVLSDITEATSILALNATVQAAKAGEAGKGFKLVADSIQELADKAGEATRRVGVLISAVQTDINAVEGSVKRTTNEVNNGVSLSELAGVSLNKMTLVSKELSEMVGLISEDAKTHAKSAKEVSNSMREILKITEMNRVSTETTTRSISEIAEISEDLGESVQSFITNPM